jgi:hypothetical protein
MALKTRRHSHNINQAHHVDDGLMMPEKDLDMAPTMCNLSQPNGAQNHTAHPENIRPAQQHPEKLYDSHPVSTELEKPEFRTAFRPSQVLMDMDDMDELALDAPSQPDAMTIEPALPVLPSMTKRRVNVTPVSPSSVARTQARTRPPSSPDALCGPLPQPESEREHVQEEVVEPRRNPKRKASTTICVSDGDDNGPAKESGDLLEKALMPMTDEEIAQWEGWIEIESEPVRLSH